MAEARKLGKDVHIYNQGASRYSFGLYQWSEYRKGVKARWQWHLNILHGYQFFDLDGREPDTAMLCYGRKEIYPTIAFERCREGAEDFYLYQTLWNLIEAKRKQGQETDAVKAAATLLESATASVKLNQREEPEGFDADDLKAKVIAAIEGLAGPMREEGRWEPEMRRLEEMDEKAPPPEGAVLFVGSSSIRGWDLPKSFPDLKTINRGFGGSQLADVVRYADRIVLPCKPRIIVLYAGDNDIASGRSPEQVAADFKAFVKKVQDALPETRVLFISIKPSIQRWKLVEKMRRANELIRDFAMRDKRLGYVDADTPMLGPDGKPRPELFKPDGLHLNDEGYKLWASLLTPLLKGE
jgi:lysophospholipase L1-like esterase